MKNAMTVDVEDYFQVSAFEKSITQNEWAKLPMRVGDNTNRLLDIFAEHNVKSTFFCLGWVAEKCPSVIQRIVKEGHELASHGYDHTRLNNLDKPGFIEDVTKSKTILEDIGGVQILGYRAPSFSVNEKTQWVYETLVNLGFVYSSSTYPIVHDLYGVPDWPRFKYQRPEGIVEIPIPTLKAKSANKGIGGGGYFRLFPYWLSNRRISRFLQTENEPYNFYFHPWEIDVDQPRVAGLSLKSRFRHYVNLGRMESKLHRLLSDFSWGTMADVYGIKEDQCRKEFVS